MGKIVTRRDFLKDSAAAAAGLALGGNALAQGTYKDGLTGNDIKKYGPNPDLRLAVFDFDYQGPAHSDYNNRSRELGYKLKNKLGEYGVPLIDAGAVIGELEFRGIDFERFLQYPGIVAHLDPKSEIIRDTDVIIGMATDYDEYDLVNTVNFPNMRLDEIHVNYVDLETGKVKATLKETGFFERAMEDQMIDSLAKGIAVFYQRFRDIGF